MNIFALAFPALIGGVFGLYLIAEGIRSLLALWGGW